MAPLFTQPGLSTAEVKQLIFTDIQSESMQARSKSYAEIRALVSDDSSFFVLSGLLSDLLQFMLFDVMMP